MQRIDAVFRRLVCLATLMSILVAMPGCTLFQSPIEATTPAAGDRPLGTETTPTVEQAMPEESTTPRPTDTPRAVLPPAAQEQDGPAIITFAASEYERQIYEPLIEAFNKQNPEIVVQFAPLPEYTGAEGEEDPYQDYYRTLASTGDTSMLWGVTYLPAHYFTDLQPLLEADSTFEADDFWPGALEACQDIEGRQLGVPMTIMLSGIFYDAAAFDAAGVARPASGWTWDDFRKAVTALTKRNGDEIRYGYAEQYNLIMSPLIEAAIDESGGEIDSESLLSVVQWYLDLIKAKAIYPPYYYDENDPNAGQDQWQIWQDMFKGENRPAMWGGSISDPMPGTEYAYGSDTSDPLKGMAVKEAGFAPFPIAADHSNVNTTPIWVQCAGVSAGSRNPRAAWAWLDFLSRQRLVQDANNPWERLQLPARISVADQAGFWEGLPSGLEETIRFSIEHAWTGTAYADVIYSVSYALTKAAAGKSDFLTALEEAKTLVAAATPSPTPNPAPIVVATPKPTLSPDVTAVDYFNQAWGADRQALQAVVNEYNEAHPGVVINLRSDFSPATQEDYLVAISKEFDCFTSWTLYWSTQKPELLGLNALMEAEGPDFIQDFDPGLLDAFRHAGELYALPAFSQPQIMSYNADLLAKRGLKPPANDWTFEDFLDLATKVSSSNEADKSYGLMFGEGDDFLFSGRGVKWADLESDPPVPLFTGPDFANGLAWIDSLNKAGVLFVQTDQNWQAMQDAFMNGQIAFWQAQAGLPEGGWFSSEQKPSFKIGVAPMFTVADPNSAFYWGSDQGHFISSQSKNPQVCWDWFKFLSEKPGVFTGVPARKSVAASPEWEALVGKENAAVYRVAMSQVVRVPPDQNISSPISWPLYIWKQQVVAALLKGEDYAKLIPQAQQKAEDYLACMAGVDRSKLTDQELSDEANRCAKQADPDGPWSTSGGGGGG